MKCPFCGHLHDKVVDSRESKDGDAIRRRRQCLHCKRRFTSYERIDEIPSVVVKKDGRRERFDRQKVLAGVLKACEKRPVSMSQLETIADTGSRYKAGVLKYAQMGYWQPDYEPKATDVIALFRETVFAPP